MPWRRSSPGKTAGGRARILPFDALTTEGNTSNLLADSRSKTRVRLVTVSSDPGPPLVEGQQTVTSSLPNWVRIVLHYAGNNEGPAEQLPVEIEVPVRIDTRTGAVVDLDVDRASAELEEHREVATRWWKEDEAPLADLRGAAALPGDAIRGVKGLFGAWKGALDGATENPAAEAEQSRRTANMLAHDLERKPKQLTKVRASALQAGPMMVDNVKGGSMSPADFETWLTFQLTSGAIDADEASRWRQEAGLA